MSLKNKADWILISVLLIAALITIISIPAAIRNATRTEPCMAQVDKVISFTRTTDINGRIHYYASIVGKDGDVCYDIELPPAEFYRLKAINEPLVH